LSKQQLMPHQVTIDARMLSTGIGTYVRNLIGSLKSCGEGLRIRALTLAEDVEWMRSQCHEVSVVDAPIYTIREQFEIPRAAHGADLLHVPHYNVPLLYKGRLLVTIHDLIHITDTTFKRGFRSLTYARPMLTLATRKADHIVTVSEYTKAQIVDRLGVSPSKITVVHNGVCSSFHGIEPDKAFREVSATLGIARPYILYVGNLSPHKNVSCLLRAYALLRGRRALDHQLLIIGDGPKWKPGLLLEAARLGIREQVSFVSHVSGDLLPQVYAGANLLVQPSFIEGFGLPVLEAMACGTPVVCSRAASMPEVAGHAAEYFEPTSVDDLASAIGRVLGSPELKETLRRKGPERAKLFSWDECARRTLEVYRKLLEK
jgi:glycosyltransferase involved in cell wall biosynthesis